MEDEPKFEVYGKRSDSVGLFWSEPKKIKPPPKAAVKRIPPERTWEQEDYLPYLEEARAHKYNLFTDEELAAAAQTNEKLVFDIECFPNYFLVAFKSIETGKNLIFELNPEVQELELEKLKWVMQSFTLMGFNSKYYDLPMLAIAFTKANTATLHKATNEIINDNEPWWTILRRYNAKRIECDHIDLMGVAPLRASLKVYSGRLHCEKMQDLPFLPSVALNEAQQDIVRYYCLNDLENTELLYRELEQEIELRGSLGVQYQLDLLSKSDAQIAEAVIGTEIKRVTPSDIRVPECQPGAELKYIPPSFISFKSQVMKNALELIKGTVFKLSEHGSMTLPEELVNYDVTINATSYTMGIGGLHSKEKNQSVYSDDEFFIVDKDVASYYPSIILGCELYPAHLGRNFLTVYKTIVDRRLKAKREGNALEADTLKITINGSFGKFGSKYSVLYSPQLLIQVTVTGQLSLLMLIERLELQGIQIVSANTDGIVIKCRRKDSELLKSITKQWELETNFVTEETPYRSIHSRDVNNYLALTEQGYFKSKGAYSKASLRNNPTNQICVTAIEQLLSNGTPIEVTVRQCRNLAEFLSVRTVKGGAVQVSPQGNTYLGKAIRWYYAKDLESELVYAMSGNKVPRSEGAFPVMQLPKQFPDNVDFDWYVGEAEKMLQEVGCS